MEFESSFSLRILAYFAEEAFLQQVESEAPDLDPGWALEGQQVVKEICEFKLFLFCDTYIRSIFCDKFTPCVNFSLLPESEV